MGGFFLAWMERRGGADLRGYLKQHSRYFILITMLGFVATGAAVDAGVWPRLLTALGLAGLSGSLYALWVAGRHPDLPETGLTRRTAAWWAVARGLLALAGGGWYSLTLPGPVAAALGAGPARWLGWLAAAGILAAVASVQPGASAMGSRSGPLSGWGPPPSCSAWGRVVWPASW